MSEAHIVFWGAVVLFWLLGVFVMARDLWKTRAGRPIGRRRYTVHLLLTLVVGPGGLFGALLVVEPVLPFHNVGWLIYSATMLLVGVFQFVLLIIGSGRGERDTDASGE